MAGAADEAEEGPELPAQAQEVSLPAPYAGRFRMRKILSPASSQEVRHVTVTRLARNGRGIECPSMEGAFAWMKQQLAASPPVQQAQQEAPSGNGERPSDQPPLCLAFHR